MIDEKQGRSSNICCFKITAIIKAKSSIHIGNGKRTGIIKHSLPFIPGSVIRGTVGKFLSRVSEIDKHNLNNMLFPEETGKSSKVFFRNCYPLHLKCNSNGSKENTPTFVPAPKTLFKCQNRQCGRLYNTYKPPLQCLTCSKSVKPFFGFRCTNCGDLEIYPVMLDRFDSSAIDRTTFSIAMNMPIKSNSGYLHTSAADNDIIRQNNIKEENQGLLHTIESIEKDTEFLAEVILSSSCDIILDKMPNLLETVLEDEGIGGSISRGYGNIHVKDIKIKEITKDIIESRGQEIIYKSQNKSSRDYENNNNNLVTNDNQKSFSVYFVSPLIIDKNQRTLDPSTLLESARRAYSWCFKEGKPSLPNLCKTNQIFSYDFFGGWSMKENRKRNEAVSISSGSTFRFEYDDNITESKFNDMGKALASLEYYAMGGYKPHGYGQTTIMSLYKE